MSKPKAKTAAAPVIDDVLSDEEIAQAAAIAEASDDADEADVESAVAQAETADAVAEVHTEKSLTKKQKAAAKKKAAAEKRAAAKAAKAKKDAKAPKEPAAPRMSLETNSASDIITTRLGSDHHDLFNLVEGRWKKPTSANLRKSMTDTLSAIDKLDKKSREKAINLFVSANNEKATSV